MLKTAKKSILDFKEPNQFFFSHAGFLINFRQSEKCHFAVIYGREFFPFAKCMLKTKNLIALKGPKK